MTIGDVAKRTRLRASAIRFYERAGLLPKPVRVGGQRRYDVAILERLAVLERAKNCGFTLDEVRKLFDDKGAHSAKWQRLARKKIAELDAAAQRIAEMKELLERGCGCATVAECGRCIQASGSRSRKPETA